MTTCGATTKQILQLREVLEREHVTTVVMEPTSDYWKPFYYLLEETLPVMLVNAKAARNIPGRKTDVSDAAWLAQLGAHGLLRASFVPPEPIRELRDLTRATAAMAVSRSQTTCFGAKYRRVKSRRGPVKALVAVEHSILTAVWHMLTTGEVYRDPGPDYFAKRQPARTRARPVQQLQALGYTVTLDPSPTPAETTGTPYFHVRAPGYRVRRPRAATSRANRGTDSGTTTRSQRGGHVPWPN